MTQAAMQASEVVQRVRSLFKKIPPERASLRLDEVIEEAVWRVRDEAARKGIPVRVNLAPGLPRAAADRVQLQQVMVNPMVNGMDSMAESDRKQLVVGARQEGTGMGLAMSRSIIEAHGGRLRVEPNEPRGATFQFVLPSEVSAK